jgi:hypothetical protein
MILAARKYNLKFTALSVSNEIKLKMPIWKHPAMEKLQYQHACRRNAASCLRLKHQVRTVDDTLTIATRRTIVAGKPHQINPPGIGQKNCGCPLCHRDRTQLSCKHPGECIDTAKILIDSILPKWNPTLPNPDLCEQLALTADEQESNRLPITIDQPMIFDPNFTLSNIEGFRIFAFEELFHSIPVRRVQIPGDAPSLLTVYLHAFVLHPGEFEPIAKLSVRKTSNIMQKSETLPLTFDRPEIPITFTSAFLGGLLLILQDTPKNMSLLICSSSDFVTRTLIIERVKFESDMLEPNFDFNHFFLRTTKPTTKDSGHF